MTKLERALKAAEQLPEEMREKLGDDVLHFVDRYLALREDLEIGVRELDAGEGLDGDTVFAELRRRFGA